MDFLKRPTRNVFFTGKGGVGKTSTSCAVAVHLADTGKRVLLVSTDPASNLDEIFGLTLGTSLPTPIPEVPGLHGLNVDPEAAAHEYKERVVGPYRRELPDAAIPLARAIATAFAQEVEDAGAEFLVVNLPARRDLQQSLAGTRLAYADLLAAIRQRHRLLDATEVLAPEAAARGLETLFVESGLHYTQRANGVVAAAIADALAPQSTH